MADGPSSCLLESSELLSQFRQQGCFEYLPNLLHLLVRDVLCVIAERGLFPLANHLEQLVGGNNRRQTYFRAVDEELCPALQFVQCLFNPPQFGSPQRRERLSDQVVKPCEGYHSHGIQAACRDLRFQLASAVENPVPSQMM